MPFIVFILSRGVDDHRNACPFRQRYGFNPLFAADLFHFCGELKYTTGSTGSKQAPNGLFICVSLASCEAWGVSVFIQRCFVQKILKFTDGC
jgi:hypothetical protein